MEAEAAVTEPVEVAAVTEAVAGAAVTEAVEVEDVEDEQTR